MFSTVAQRADLIVHQPRFQPHSSPAVSWAMHWVNRSILSVHAEEEDEAEATIRRDRGWKRGSILVPRSLRIRAQSHHRPFAAFLRF